MPAIAAMPQCARQCNQNRTLHEISIHPARGDRRPGRRARAARALARLALPALDGADPAGPAVPGRADLAAMAGAPDGEQRPARAIDCRYAVGRTDPALRAGAQRGSTGRARRRPRRRAAAAGQAVSALPPDVYQWPGTGARGLERCRRRPASHPRQRPACRRPAACHIAGRGDGALDPARPLQRALRRHGIDPRRDRLLPAAVSRRPVRRQPGGHLQPAGAAR